MQGVTKLVGVPVIIYGPRRGIFYTKEYRRVMKMIGKEIKNQSEVEVIFRPRYGDEELWSPQGTIQEVMDVTIIHRGN